MFDNLLKKAQSIIPKQSFDYLEFTGRTTNEIGIDIATYSAAVQFFGSVQPIPRKVYQEMGLDWKKNYINIYSSDIITGIERDSSGDKIIFNGVEFQALSENDWQPIDGWQGVLFVEA